MIVTFLVWVIQPSAVIMTVTVELPGTVGVPLMAPVSASMLTPAGSVPEDTEYTMLSSAMAVEPTVVVAGAATPCASEMAAGDQAS